MLRDEPRFICFCTLLFLLEVSTLFVHFAERSRGDHCWTIASHSGRVLAFYLQLTRERDFSVQPFFTGLVVVNSINFDTAAVVVLMVPVMTQLMMV